MKLADMKKKSKADLVKHEAKLRTELAQAKQDRAMSKTTDHNVLRKLRREIAQTLTVMKTAGEDKKEDK